MIISNTKKRKGMILLVVVAFLAMFTVMGLTYLLHADNQLKNSIDELLALDMKEDPYKIIDLKPSVALDFFLEKFLYDQLDTVPLQGNAIRGQSLARNIYGGYVSGGLNDKAFSGIGKLNKDFVIVGSTIKEWQMVNYSFSNALNPERLNDGGSGVKTSTWNAPYTYPDHNNFYLGWLKSDGTKVIPSFHRDAIFNSMAAPFANPNWTNAQGKYFTPRPRPFDHGKDINGNYLFPYPDADGMDVKNLEGYPGGNDSIWIDVGSPVYTALDGRKYKILVAPLILDLDGRINVNVAGNVMGAGNTNASNQGWGPWEVNLSTALGGTANAITEAQQIIKGYSAGGALLLPGVYGTAGVPGGTNLPAVNAASPWGTTAATPHPYITPTYAMIDFNAKSEIGVNAPLALSNSFASFPTFSGNYNSNVVTNEFVVDGSHPSFVNPQRIKTGNSKFTNNELASLIRWSGQGSAPKATNLVNLLKNTLGADYIYDNSTIAVRNRITTLSADIQQSTLLPYSFSAAGGASPYISNFTYPTYPLSDTSTNPKSLPYPLAKPLAFPIVGTTNIAPGSKSDFPSGANLVTGVSPIVGYMKQINLNRNLNDYPKINTNFTNAGGGGGRYLNNTGYATAVSDRQNFATEIFNGLKLATGVEASDFEANRYLAQLAANMVDYIDYDDVMTEFIWKYDPDPTKYERVYGVELNKVVLNEVYAEIINDPTDKFPETPAGSNKFPANAMPDPDPLKDKPFQVHFWVELMNPLPVAPVVVGSFENHALLEQDPRVVAGDSSVYQLEIRDQSAVDDIFKPDNPLGITRPDVTGNDRRKVLVSNFQPAVAGGVGVNLLAPAAGNYLGTENTANGFIVLGSNTPFPNSGPMAADMPMPYSDINNIANIKKNELKYTIAIPDPAYNKAKFSTSSTPLQTTHKPSIVLRRLANPYMPPQTDATKPDYNPYVTVDVMNDIRVNDAVTNASDDKKAAPPTVENRSSVVRQQPYQEAVKKDVGANLANPLVKQPQHTFLRHNGTTITAPPVVPLGAASTDTMLKLPFKWLMHLDRKLINSLEILNISGCKPSEVTQRFSNPIYVDSNNKQIENKAPWLDEASNLYRFLALADVQGYQQGTAFAGRQIGKININNIWDKEVFNALCDANANNNFTQAEVDTIFNNFLTGRSPTNLPAFGDNPLWGFGVGKSTGGDNWTSAARGIDNSVLRGAGTGSGVFDLLAVNVAGVTRDSNQRKELLSKIANNITTKSNVFGVWVTTGYFEVTDDTTNPPTLGAEIGKIAGRNIRHRMFAIVDRTNMSAFSTNLVDTGLLSTNPSPNPPTPLPTTLVPGVGACPNISAGMNVVNWIRTGVNQTGKTWSFSAGMLLTFDPNTDNEETVQLQDVGGGVLGATFTKNHAANCTIINRGNPGPWVGYDRTKDREVVPYAEIIE